jgi:peptidoglycan hydrolase-like protein with peptidoglycan-binding domain
VARSTTRSRRTRALLRAIEQTGQDRFGAGISYTFVVTRSGRIFEGHGVTRAGTHTRGHNATARAICLPGNYETLQPTKGQLEAVAWLLAHGAKQGWWAAPQLAGGHRDAPGAATACPGRNALDAIGAINSRAVALAGGAAPAPVTAPAPAGGLTLVAPARATQAQAQAWARTKNAHPRFADDIIPALYRAAATLRSANAGTGIDPAVVVAQAAKETGWGRYSGVLSAEFMNTGGIKTARGGGDYDPDAHQRFASWDDGARAHLNHLAAYVGLRPVGTPHGRYYTVLRTDWAGTVRTVEQLGARWAPASSYGTDIVRMVGELAARSAPTAPAPAPAPQRATLRNGSRGPAVVELQLMLGGLRPDGVFGPVTDAAVRRFQSAHSLTVDGVVGPRTWAALDAAQRRVAALASAPAPAPAPAPVARPVLRQGARGEHVAFLQQRLKHHNRLFDYSAGPGIFGPATDREVRAFQQRHRLVVDGIVGPRTWSALGA